jgi:hypothetical protein
MEKDIKIIDGVKNILMQSRVYWTTHRIMQKITSEVILVSEKKATNYSIEAKGFPRIPTIWHSMLKGWGSIQDTVA